MKKLCTIMLVCMLLMPCLIGLAEEMSVAQTKEITFRGLPFGSSISEVKAKLIAEGMEEKNISVSLSDYGYTMSCSSVADSPVKLAGYDLRYLTIEFYYTIKDETLNKSQEDVGLVSAKYQIDDSAFSLDPSKGPDRTRVMKILATKITALYGEPTAAETITKYISGYSNVYNRYCMRTTWQGANNASILLDRDYRSYNRETITVESDFSVVYQLCDIPALETRIAELEEKEEKDALQLVEDEIQEGTSDLTGL